MSRARAVSLALLVVGVGALATVGVLAFRQARGGSGAGQEYAIRWKFSEGRRLTYDARVTFEEMSGWQSPYPGNVTGTVRVTFLCPENGVALCQYECIAAEPSSPNGTEKATTPLVPEMVESMMMTTIGYEDGTWIDGLPEENRNMCLMMFPIPGRAVQLHKPWDAGIGFTSMAEKAKSRNKPMTVRTSAQAALEQVQTGGLADISLACTAETTDEASNSQMTMKGSGTFDMDKGCLRKSRVAVDALMMVTLKDRENRIGFRNGVALELKEDRQLSAEELARARQDLAAWRMVYGGMALAKAGKSAPASDAFRKALEAKPNVGRANVQLAKLHVAENRMEEAMTCLRNELRCQPGSIEIRPYLRQLLSMPGKKGDAAVICLENEVKARPGSREAHLLLMQLHQLAGRKDEAAREAEVLGKLQGGPPAKETP